MYKIEESLMRRLLDDSGWSVAKITPEPDFIRREFHKQKGMYEMMIGIGEKNLSHRKKCERLVIEHDGRTLLVAVEAVINLGE